MKELRRRARVEHSFGSQALYQLASYGVSLDIFCWILLSADVSIMVLAAANLSRWLVVMTVFIAFWLVLLRHRPGRTSFLVARYAAMPTSWLLGYLNSPLAWLATVTRQKSFRGHTGAYEKDDLLEIIANQATQSDNRVEELDLQTARGALTFGDKVVGSTMTPKKKVKIVSIDEPIGPILMDELHASGFSRFPVTRGPAESASWQIVGTLYLRDLVGHPDKGKVRDLTEKKVFYINEAQNLREALGAFMKTGQHMLLVTNNFEEIVGILNIEDVIGQILGQPKTDEFEHYSNQRAVAGMEINKASRSR